jgi:CBS domain-containing protein
VASEAAVWGDRTVADVMLRKPKTLPAGSTVADVVEFFGSPRQQIALLVEDDGVFRGALTRGDLPGDADPGAPALGYARPATPIAPTEPAAAAFEQIALHPDRRMVVLDDDGETLIGLLCLNTRKTDFCGTPS